MLHTAVSFQSVLSTEVPNVEPVRFGAAPLDEAAVAELEAEPVGAVDDAQAEIFALPNGLRCIYVFDKARGAQRGNIASLAVSVAGGYVTDPPDAPGLVHLIQRVLCLGSVRYPAPGALRTYCAAYGCDAAAATNSDDVAFTCELPVEGLPGALERMGDMLRHALMASDMIDRAIDEIEALHRERVRDDDACLWQLRRDLAHRDHPLRGFGTGSAASLRGIPRAVLESYMAEWVAQYVTGAGVACSVVIGDADMLTRDEFEALCLETLSGLPPGGRAPCVPREVAAPCFAKEALGLWVDVKRTSDGADLLQLTFPMDGYGRGRYASLAVNFVSHFLSSRDQGAMLETMVTRNLVQQGVFGVEHVGTSWALIGASFVLAPAGAEDPVAVVRLFFEGIHAVRASLAAHGIRRLWEDMRRVLDLHLTICGGASVMLTAAQIAARAHYITDWEHLLMADIAFLEYSAADIEAVLDAFSPRNMLAIHASAAFDAEALPLRSGWGFNAPHCAQRVPTHTLRQWGATLGGLSPARPVRLEWLAGCTGWIGARRHRRRSGQNERCGNVFDGLPRVAGGVPLYRPGVEGAFYPVITPAASGEGLVRVVHTVPECASSPAKAAALHLIPELLIHELKNFMHDALWCRAKFLPRVHPLSQCRLEFLIHGVEPAVARIAIDALAAVADVVGQWSAARQPFPDAVFAALKAACRDGVVEQLTSAACPRTHARLQMQHLRTLEAPHSARVLCDALANLTPADVLHALPAVLLCPSRTAVFVYGSSREAVRCDDLTAYLEESYYPSVEALAARLPAPPPPPLDKRECELDAYPRRRRPPLVADAQDGPPHYLSLEQSMHAAHRLGRPSCAVYEICFPPTAAAAAVCGQTAVLSVLLNNGLRAAAEDAGIEEAGCVYNAYDSCTVCCLHAVSAGTHALDLLHLLRGFVTDLTPPFDAAVVEAARRAALSSYREALAEGAEMEGGEGIDPVTLWGCLDAARSLEALEGLARTATRDAAAYIESCPAEVLGAEVVALLGSVMATFSSVATIDDLAPFVSASAADPEAEACGLERVNVRKASSPAWVDADTAALEFYRVASGGFEGPTAVAS